MRGVYEGYGGCEPHIDGDSRENKCLYVSNVCLVYECLYVSNVCIVYVANVCLVYVASACLVSPSVVSLRRVIEYNRPTP